jgi:hypothetical protein
MNLGAKNFDISQSFKDLKLLQSLAPIAKVLQGKLNTVIQLSGTLDQTFSPELNSVTGTALAELLTTTIKPENTALLEQLSGAIGFIDFDKLDLKDLKTKLNFEDGKVNVKPFNLKYKDIAITVDGSHGFDKSMNYNAIFQVPAKYLGSEINQLIGRINDDAVNNIKIPVIATIGGTYTAPTVSTDLSSGITKLTKQLLEIEKQKLITQGSGQLANVINDVFTQNDNAQTPPTTTEVDSTKTNTSTTIENEIKNVLGGLFNKNKKKKDSLN